MWQYFTVWLIITFLLSGCMARTGNSEPAPDMMVNLGMFYLQKGDFTKARMAFNQALADQPRAPSAWGAMAYLEEISGNLAIAESYYRRAIQLSPQQGDGHNNYGVFLCRHGRPRAGIQEMLIATQLSSYVDRAAAYENASLCALTIPDTAAANNYLNAAVRNGLQYGIK